MIHRAWLYVHGKREAGSQTDGLTDRDQTRITISGRQSFDPKSEIDSGNTARGASRIDCVAARMIVVGRGNHYPFLVGGDDRQGRWAALGPGRSKQREQMGADRRDRSR